MCNWIRHSLCAQSIAVQAASGVLYTQSLQHFGPSVWIYWNKEGHKKTYQFFLLYWTKKRCFDSWNICWSQHEWLCYNLAEPTKKIHGFDKTNDNMYLFMFQSLSDCTYYIMHYINRSRWRKKIQMIYISSYSQPPAMVMNIFIYARQYWVVPFPLSCPISPAKGLFVWKFMKTTGYHCATVNYTCSSVGQRWSALEGNQYRNVINVSIRLCAVRLHWERRSSSS